MVRSFLFLLVFLILAAPRFVSVEYYIVDTIADGVIRLEPFHGGHAPLPAQDSLYVTVDDYWFLAESQVVVCFKFRGEVLGIVPDPAQTKSRRNEIKALIKKIGTTDLGND